MANQKHVFDFEGILSMDIDQKNWKEIKQKLDGAFGELKVGIENGIAEEEAKKYVALFNKVFAKAQLPDIGVDDLRHSFDKVSKSITDALGVINNIDTSALKGIESSLDHISSQVDVIVSKVGKGVQQGVNGAVASVAKLDAALSKVGNSTKEIEDALNFSNDGGAKKQLNVLKALSEEWEKLEINRIEANKNGRDEDIQNWVARQQAMAKYVRAYEDYFGKLKNKKKVSKEYTALYDKLLPKSFDAKTNLQNLLDRRAGTYSPKGEPWAKEQTLKEVRDILKNGIKVDGGVDSEHSKPPKKNPPQNPKGAIVYRTVYEPEEPDKRTRAEILESWGGAEYWTNKKEVADTYADGQENPVRLMGRIIATKPFIIDAKGRAWNDFQNMSVIDEDADGSGNVSTRGLKDVFPEIFDMVQRGELTDPADIQTELNRAIKELGHDVIETRNVIDTNNEKLFKQQSTTYAVLDDRVLRVEKAFAMEEQDRDGITTFAPKASEKNIPEYYKMPEASEVAAEVVKQTKAKTTNPQKTQEHGESAGVVSEISNKMDNLATDSSVNSAKDAIVSAVKEAKDGANFTIDTQSLTDTLNAMQATSNKKDAVSAILENRSFLERLLQSSNEAGAFYNSESGFAGEVIEGGAHSIITTMEEWQRLAQSYDARIHTHNFDIAAPSVSGDNNDFSTWIKGFDHIKKQMIVSKKEILSFDFTSLTKETLQTIATLYSEAASKISAEFDGYIEDRKVGEMFGSLENMTEQMQRRLREALEAIMKNYSGVMTSHSLPAEIGRTKQPDMASVMSSLVEAINKLQTSQNNDAVVTTIQGLMDHLGYMVGQEDTLQEVKAAIDELKSAGFNVDVSPESITTAIKEALYASEIETKYRPMEFYDSVDAGWDGLTSKLTGELFSSIDEAREYFLKYIQGQIYVGATNNNSDFIGTKEEVLSRISKDRVEENAPVSNDWARVIVEAINTQGNRIVESIKIILPQNVTNAVVAGEGLDEAKIRNAFDVLTDAILRFNDATGEAPRDFFGKLKKDDLIASVFRDADVDDALRTLGLMDGYGKFTFTMPDTGIRNLGVAIADRLVVTSQDADNVDNITELQAKLDEASKLGAAVPRILGLAQGSIRDQWANEAIFQLQTKAPGLNVASHKANNEFLNATDEQIDKLIHTFEVMSKVGLFPDFIGDNVLFDQEKGFSLVDLETQNIHSRPMDTSEDMVKAFMRKVLGDMSIDPDTADAFKRRVESRQKLSPDQRLVDEFGNPKTHSGAPSAIKITPVMDEGAVAKVVQDNVANTPVTVKITPVVDNQNGADTTNTEVANLELIKSAVNDVTAAVNLKTKAFADEETEVQRVVAEEMESLGMLEKKIISIKTTLENLTNNIKSGTNDIGEGLSNIVVNVNYPEKSEPENETSLEATLNKVFANILNPKTQKNTGSNRNVDINPHYLTDPRGKVVTAYRGIRDNYAGLVSGRYHGGTFSTDDIELAKVYAGELGKIEKVFLSMKNPLEIDGHGAQWDRIEYLGHGADEASRKLIELTKNIKILEDYYLSHPTGDVVHPLTGELMHDIESIREEILELRNLKEQISQDPTNPYGVGTTNHFAELAKANGYDGVIFKNVYDGLQKASNIMVTFEQDQIHYIETIGATATEAFKQLHSQAGDFNQYIGMADDDIAGFVERLRQIHGEINTLMFDLYGNPDALEAAFQESKGKYIDTDPALKALYDAKLAPRDLPDDYLQLPGFLGSPFFDAEGLEVTLKQAIEFARNELNRIQAEFGTTATNIDEYQSEIGGQVDVRQEPWALESTLQTVKGVLDNIQNNTAKIGVVTTPAVDPIAGTALDGRLTAIKSILESINNKIVEGGVIFTNGDGRRGTKDAGSKGKPARTTQFNSLIKDYENIGRLSAQFANDGNLETKAKIDLLKKEIETKRASLKLSIDENLVLRQKYRAALEAQKKLLDAARAQKVIDDKRKTADDDAKKHEKDADIERKEQAKAQASRQAQVKSLAKDYEKLGKLAAQFDDDGNLETKAKLELLKEEIKTKRASLKLSIDENLILRQQYSAAFDAQKRLLEAAKTQKGIDDQWKKQVKDAQRATGINAATSVANAGDQTVLRTIGTSGVSDGIEAKAKKLSDHIKTLRKLRDEIDQQGEKVTETDRDNLSKQIAQVKQLKTEMDGYLKIHEKYSGDNVTDLGDASNFGAVGSNEYWNNITAAVKAQAEGRVAIKGLNAETGELTGTTKIAANTFETWSATVDPLTGRLSMLRTGIKKTETLVESITRKTKEIFTYFSGSSIIFKFFNEVRRGIQYIKEIDLALTELKKVTDETEETYDRFLETAAKTGARLGATISAVTEATATFAKLGYDMVTATEMAEAAIVYKNVGDNIASTEDAADSIISTLKGFGMEASEAMAIVDRFNEVGNRFAITSQGIGEALRLSASALNEGGNSLDESIAMITAANEVVNDPSAVGTALKTLTLRLRGSKTELEEMGEDVSDMATTTSQLQAKLLALTGGQVDIMVNPTTFKNSTQILREMAEAWEDMDDISRASALELMGGRLLPLRIEICA